VSEPLSDEQARLNAAALHVFPDLIHPEDEEMRAVAESLVERGSLVAVYETDAEPDPDVDLLIGYQASEQLRAAMMIRSAMN
jgi:hypothetical protein